MRHASSIFDRIECRRHRLRDGDGPPRIRGTLVIESHCGHTPQGADLITASEPLTPPALERLVGKCLAKSSDARWHSAADLADEFRWLSADTGSIAAAPRPARWVSRHPWIVAAGALLSIVAAAIAVWRWQTPVPGSEAHVELQYTQATFDGNVLAAALSPDAKTIAYLTGDPGHEHPSYAISAAANRSKFGKEQVRST
jgi:hypothetical protein